MDFLHFRTAAQFGRIGVNARFARRLALYRRLATRALAELAKERGEEIGDFTCAYCGIRRYHLPGQHDQCDHSPTGECSFKESQITDKQNEQIFQYKSWQKKMSRDERMALSDYSTDEEMFLMNQSLRQKSVAKGIGEPKLKKWVTNLDSVLSKAKTTQDIVVYRGMNFEPEQLGLIQGAMIVDGGYVSTSRIRSIGENFASKGIIAQIKIPAGSKAAYLKGVSGRSEEREVLLPRGSKFKVTEIIPRGDQHIVKMELLP